ncbi:MAG TPA: hypothetical protein PLE22_01385 [Acidovorax sp.]|jgi:hypothetical protein|nr:hypothetical protein [Acidovorax sp.]
MANKPTPAPKSKEVAVEMAAIEQTMAAANQLAVATLEQNERVSALAKQLNYQGSTDPGALENSARDAAEYLGKSIYMLGSCLILLKEASDHGSFLAALERLNITPRSAQRYMAMAQRFANATMSSHLEKLGYSKMAELLPLDDEQAGELAELGQTGELALDDVARMSVKELRAAVRKERAEAAKQKSQVERLTSVNTELHEEARLAKRLPANEALAKLKKEAASIAADAEGAILGGLRQALIALNNHGEERGLHNVYMSGLVGQVQAQLNALRQEFNLPDVSNAADQKLAAEMAEWDKE